MQLLVPSEVAERCYLSEALCWIALRRIPIGFVTENGIDQREDPEYADDAYPEPCLPHIETVDDEEASRVGLPTCPEWQEIVAGDYHPSLESLREMMERGVPYPPETVREAEEFHRRQAAWDAEFDEF